MSGAQENSAIDHPTLVAALGNRSIVMIGLMGCGKSSVGRRLATTLDLSFVDADEEIERAAGKSIPDIFEEHGEAHFRERESLVIGRLLRDGPQVLATGGGAYMRASTREIIGAIGVSVWLRAELQVLMRRVLRRDNRPLLRTADPEEKMRSLMEERYPIYGLADLTVDSRDTSHDVVVKNILTGLHRHFAKEARP
ncbi:MAG: shikimate kinase [Hyphomicrobiaceae bacterium]